MRDRLIELIQASVGGCARNWAEVIADYLLENGVIVLPCMVGDEINGEIVCEILYSETLGFEGAVHRNKQLYTCDKDDTEKRIYTTHHMTWEKAEQTLKEGVQE